LAIVVFRSFNGSFQPCSPPACTVLSTALKSFGWFAVPLLQNLFPDPEIDAFRLTANSLFNGAGRSHRPFPRPQRLLPLRSFHSGVNGPGLTLHDPSQLIPRPVRFPLPCLRWFAPLDGSFFASNPLRFRLLTRSAAFPVSTPLQDCSVLRDQSFQPVPPPFGAPSESARFPLAPRSRFYL